MADNLQTTFCGEKVSVNIVKIFPLQNVYGTIHMVHALAIVPSHCSFHRGHCHAQAESVTLLHGLLLFLSEVKCSPTVYEVREMQWIVITFFIEINGCHVQPITHRNMN